VVGSTGKPDYQVVLVAADVEVTIFMTPTLQVEDLVGQVRGFKGTVVDKGIEPPTLIAPAVAEVVPEVREETAQNRSVVLPETEPTTQLLVQVSYTAKAEKAEITMEMEPTEVRQTRAEAEAEEMVLVLVIAVFPALLLLLTRPQNSAVLLIQVLQPQGQMIWKLGLR
jgi:hypothetical protein